MTLTTPAKPVRPRLSHAPPADDHDGESGKTWTPVEEQPRLTGHQVPELLCPADMGVGDRGAGSMCLFICPECPQQPVLTIHQ